MEMNLAIMGVVRSPFPDRQGTPKMEHEGGAVCRIELDPAYASCLEGLAPGQEVLLLTWLHLSDRSCLRVHPRGDRTRPARGVFSTRSPDRPNPMGLHHVRILSLEDAALTVFPLEALDGTPLVDIKPLTSAERPPDWGPGVDSHLARSIADICAAAWTRGLLSGVNGNVSVRVGEQGDAVVITRRGAAKGRLAPGDLIRLDLATGKRAELSGSARPSTEAPMHLAIYDRLPHARAIVHTHPPCLLALEQNAPGQNPLAGLDLFEARLFVQQMALAGELQPGSVGLAEAVASAAAGAAPPDGPNADPLAHVPQGESHAVFLSKHGLVCWGEDLNEALALTEELESLARVKLLALAARKEP